jgi:hypothetical protein
MLLLLVTLVCGGSNAAISRHLDITVSIPVEQQVSDDRLQALVDSQSHLHTPPESHPIREKVRVRYSSQTGHNNLILQISAAVSVPSGLYECTIVIKG